MSSTGRGTGHQSWRLPGLLSLPEDVWRTRHRWVTTVLLAHLPLLAGWTLYRHTPLLAAAPLAIPAALYLLATAEQLTRGRLRVHRALASCAAAAGLMACSSYLVSVSGGYIEAHFHFFVMVPVVALYEAWAPFSIAIAWVLLEHGLVGTLWPHHVYGHNHEHMAHPWRFAGVHAAFFAAACTGSLTAWTLAERARAVQADLVEQLRHQTLHDDLTGLANRAHLAQTMDSVLASGASVAVLALDLDRFKEVNDTLGHSAGDELLRAVSARAATGVERPGLLVRLGGDEFAVLLPGLDAQEALAVAQRLRMTIARTTSLQNVERNSSAGTSPGEASLPARTIAVSIDVSIGIAHRPALPTGASGALGPAQRAQVADELLREADVAMYTAKRSGSGTALYEAATDSYTACHLATLTDFRRALDADDQIVVHLQPKVAITNGQLLGVEALARWNHPVRGLLAPSEFIAMATSAELSAPFTTKVLTEALFACRSWLRRGYRVPVSVNITAHCLVRPSFAFEVADLLARQRVPADLLCLEITEDTLVADPTAAAQVLAALRATGVRTSIDDFGTGYSSLSYLRQLPVDELKIDRSFVLALFPHGSDEPADDALVATIVDMGHRLGMHVVAEGVERRDELAVLAGLGCDSVQGYLYSPPVPADRFPVELLRTAARTTPSAGYQVLT
ncbi:putative bifunctional diguanylate cyclase/phosphodiesterase [Quadrisphaera setariae]|uniref:Bifunctional diguanylate cyclase/phosphodiesterase n=1 Tax=Quadrisphaera setariae TaxID=2593304 RepID=A0A5C8ZIZ4_9ACTN|nr:bifunctional diguanylate cyclase/phosphodiesterase [Quadrisphaera setariae]TXR57574.1 bifunctional diguanylate cyclase/phosphodiesterase [Quadrisphaera setariae]